MVLLGERKGSYVFFVNRRSLSHLLYFLTGLCFYEGFVPLLKDQRLKHQNHNQHERSQGERPAGAHCFSSNGKTTATTQTKPGRQLSDGLCVPDSMADP